MVDAFDRELLALIEKSAPTLKPRPAKFGITSREYAEGQGINDKSARARLAALEAGGLLTSEMMRFGGHRGRVWYVKGKVKK